MKCPRCNSELTKTGDLADFDKDILTCLKCGYMTDMPIELCQCDNIKCECDNYTKCECEELYN